MKNHATQSLHRLDNNRFVLDSSTYEGFRQTHGVVAVRAWAPWCASCRVMAKRLEDTWIEMDNSFSLAEINVDRNTSISQNLHIRYLPELIIFSGGLEIARHNGEMSKQEVMGLLKSALGSSSDTAEQLEIQPL